MLCMFPYKFILYAIQNYVQLNCMPILIFCMHIQYYCMIDIRPLLLYGFIHINCMPYSPVVL